MPPLTTIQLSKYLSLILRHEPGTIGLTLDEQGWADIDELLMRINAAGTETSLEDLQRIVATSDKKRFSISADGSRVRAAQGHSISVQLDLPQREPPLVLYHGTATQVVDAILAEGLRPMARQHVHLSADEATAKRVGRRHGEPVVFEIDAFRMHVEGFKFFVAENGVWLTDNVPARFLRDTRGPGIL